MADKTDVITECKKQQYNIKVRIKLSLEEMEILIVKIKSDLSKVVSRYKLNNVCSTKEKDFLLSEIAKFLHCLENSKKSYCGKANCGWLHWILTPASIFVGHYLKQFYSKFEGI